jgi:hypothetical protein
MLSFVKSKKPISSAPQRLWNELQGCWPAIKGSLALVHKPCIRPNCPTCASGKKHPNYLLALTDQGRRRCLYVPSAMVPALKRALKNGRRIEQLLYQMGPALLEEYRAQHPAQTGPTVALRKPSAKKHPPKS